MTTTNTDFQSAPRVDAHGRVRVKSLAEITTADLEIVGTRQELPPAERAQWMFGLLESVRNFPHHFLPINSYQHCLQTATRARRAGESDELVVAALFHDLFDDLSAWHANPAAELLLGYVPTDIYWMVRHHAIFQAAYKQYLSPEARTAHRQFEGHPAYELTRRFCADYDNPSFDAEYDSLPLQAFSEAASKVFASARYLDR